MTRPLNGTMLNIISATQAMKRLALAELALGGPTDWVGRTEVYYLAIDESLVREAGLKRNSYDFERVLHFPITAEIGNTPFGDLGRFCFETHHPD